MNVSEMCVGFAMRRCGGGVMHAGQSRVEMPNLVIATRIAQGTARIQVHMFTGVMTLGMMIGCCGLFTG
jgi:hypothetical protein